MYIPQSQPRPPRPPQPPSKKINPRRQRQPLLRQLLYLDYLHTTLSHHSHSQLYITHLHPIPLIFYYHYNYSPFSSLPLCYYYFLLSLFVFFLSPFFILYFMWKTLQYWNQSSSQLTPVLIHFHRFWIRFSTFFPTFVFYIQVNQTNKIL